MNNRFRNFCVAGFVALSGASAFAQSQDKPLPNPDEQQTNGIKFSGRQDQTEHRKTSLVVMGMTRHFGDRTFMRKGELTQYNENNTGGGIEYRVSERYHISGGVYDNSVFALTAVFVAGMESDGRKRIGFGAEAGGATGYRYMVTPVGDVFLRLGKRDEPNIQLKFMPAPEGVVFSFQGRIPVGPRQP